MEDETVKLWNKQTSDMTVGDSVKFAVGVTVITTLVTFGIFAGTAGIVRLSEKLQERKAKKSEETSEEE